jgi:hypothetical protein
MNQQLYRIPDSFADAALIKQSDYRRMYAESVEDPERFWGRIGRRLDWIKDFSRVKDSNYEQSNVHIRWFYDGTRSGKIMRRILRKIAANGAERGQATYRGACTPLEGCHAHNYATHTLRGTWRRQGHAGRIHHSEVWHTANLHGRHAACGGEGRYTVGNRR